MYIYFIGIPIEIALAHLWLSRCEKAIVREIEKVNEWKWKRKRQSKPEESDLIKQKLLKKYILQNGVLWMVGCRSSSIVYILCQLSMSRLCLFFGNAGNSSLVSIVRNEFFIFKIVSWFVQNIREKWDKKLITLNTNINSIPNVH